VQVLEGYPVPRKLGAGVAISAACSLSTAPILWLQFGSVPLLGVAANALVEPAVGPLLGLALVTAAVDPVAPSLASLLAWLNGWIAAYVAGCARLVSSVPFAQANGRAAALAGLGALVFGAYAWMYERFRRTS
jgi:predicted membrane metal-binding protein